MPAKHDIRNFGLTISYQNTSRLFLWAEPWTDAYKHLYLRYVMEGDSLIGGNSHPQNWEPSLSTRHSDIKLSSLSVLIVSLWPGGIRTARFTLKLS